MAFAGQNEIMIAIGENTVSRALAIAPQATLNTLRRWMLHERKTFVGSSKQDGTFRRAIMARKLRGREGTWPFNVARSFKGYLENEKQVEGMTLHMGVGFNHGNKFTQGIAKMEEGYTTAPTSAQWMPIPIYKNLAAKGITSNFQKAFRDMMRTSSLDPVFVRGRAMFFDDSGGHTGTFGSLLFAGARKAQVKKQFSFVKAWNQRIPSAMQRGEKRLERMIRAVERGYVEAK